MTIRVGLVSLGGGERVLRHSARTHTISYGSSLASSTATAARSVRSSCAWLSRALSPLCSAKRTSVKRPQLSTHRQIAGLSAGKPRGVSAGGVAVRGSMRSSCQSAAVRVSSVSV